MIDIWNGSIQVLASSTKSNKRSKVGVGYVSHYYLDNYLTNCLAAVPVWRLLKFEFDHNRYK